MSAAPNSTESPLDYIGWLEARLEIDKIFTASSDDEAVLVERVLTPAERRKVLDSGFDGIGCRNETIWLQAEELRLIRKRQREMVAQLELLVKHGAYTKEGSAAHGMAISLSKIINKYAK